MRLITTIIVFCFIAGSINVAAQPSKSYKKQLKIKEKSAKHAESFAAEQEQSAEKLKKYKKVFLIQKITLLNNLLILSKQLHLTFGRDLIREVRLLSH